MVGKLSGGNDNLAGVEQVPGNGTAGIHFVNEGIFFFGAHVGIDVGVHTDFGESDRVLGRLTKQPVNIDVAFDSDGDTSHIEFFLHSDDATDCSDASGERNEEVFQRSRPRSASACRGRLVNNDRVSADATFEFKF